MGRRKVQAAQEDTKNIEPAAEPPAEPETEEAAPKTRKPKAIDVAALREKASEHDDADASQLLLSRLDTYAEAEGAFNEAKEALELSATRVRKAAALLD